MELMLAHTGHLNFTRMARCERSRESRFRQNFRKALDWLSFNKSFLESTKGYRVAIAIDSCYVPKSGKKTVGLDWFWSGCAAAMKKGLEILVISIADADANDAIFLKAEQTFTDKRRGRRPKCTKGMDDPDSLAGWYLRMLLHNCKQLLSVCSLIVADAYFSKESFVTGVERLGFDLVSRVRDDVRLRYLYSGPKAHKRGRPQEYAGKVDLKNLDMFVFAVHYATIGKTACKLYTAVGLDRDVRVVIADYEDADKRRQARKAFFSTDIIRPPGISSTFTEHASRWSSSSAMRSSSPASLTARRITRKPCRSPSTPPSLPSTLPGLSPVSKGWIFPSVLPKQLRMTAPSWKIDGSLRRFCQNS